MDIAVLVGSLLITYLHYRSLSQTELDYCIIYQGTACEVLNLKQMQSFYKLMELYVKAYPSPCGSISSIYLEFCSVIVSVV